MVQPASKLAVLCCIPVLSGTGAKIPPPGLLSRDGKDGNSCKREETWRKTLNQIFIRNKATSCAAQFLELTTVQESSFKACSGSDPDAAKAKKKPLCSLKPCRLIEPPTTPALPGVALPGCVRKWGTRSKKRSRPGTEAPCSRRRWPRYHHGGHRVLERPWEKQLGQKYWGERVLYAEGPGLCEPPLFLHPPCFFLGLIGI